ncbi:MAG TPA: DUF5691 domain-containing protein [Aggregatilinea sp.]|uniref:DUF5691 domain-containing protein n=1 Tax=Aggregatilinea sp. TaxID=2806333 RepID=UPI002BD060D7|nr:DUF5691 domain-containing protein [Aggregatilinea sp.]HML20880.1 DUF5691 domain-containing protein [Aggregatilinea sp.]
MTLPPDMISSAALGTDQGVFRLPRFDGAFGDLLAQIDGANLEAQLLIAAAALKLRAQAGWVPPHATRPLPEPCAPDEIRPCGRQALGHLMVMLDGHYREVLPEWLRELARQKKHIPEEALPLALEAGHKSEPLRDLLRPVIGQRGHWLAAEATTRQWDWLEPRHAERTWERGSPEARLALLKLLRKCDPARARDLLAGSWQSQNAFERVSFLQTFEDGLSMEDEPFLEAALDDRADRIRAAAIRPLAALPESRFNQRMRARALPLLVRSRSGLRRRPVMDVLPCPAYDPAMERDGIGREPPDGDLPAPLWWSQTALRWTAPSFWCAQWQIGLEELIEAAQNSDARFSLVSVLADAAEHTGESEALFLLLNADPTLAAQFAASRHLTPAQRERLAVMLLNTHREGFRRGHPAETMLKTLDRSWGRELSEAFLDSLSRYLQRERIRADSAMRFMLLEYARVMSLDMKERYLQALDVKTSAEQVWEAIVDEIGLLFDFRREMLAAIDEDD